MLPVVVSIIHESRAANCAPLAYFSAQTLHYFGTKVPTTLPPTFVPLTPHHWRVASQQYSSYNHLPHNCFRTWWECHAFSGWDRHRSVLYTLMTFNVVEIVSGTVSTYDIAGQTTLAPDQQTMSRVQCTRLFRAEE